MFSRDGTVVETYWRWDQTEAPNPANVLTWRAMTGYTTAGCPQVCDVWTAKGFEPGAAPQHRTGTWSFASNGDVHIAWPDGHNEYYAVVDDQSYVQLTLVTDDYEGVSTVYASVFGSNAPLDQGVTIDAIKAVGSLVGTFHSQNWDAVTASSTTTLYFDQYNRCTASPTMQGVNPAVYHTYFAGNPATDGRKTYWYHQLASVAQDTTCANINRGGHTYQLLQVLDDGGGFIGWVGAEASLLSQTYGGSIITQTQMIKP